MALEVCSACLVITNPAGGDGDALLLLVELEKGARGANQEGFDLALVALVGNNIEGVVDLSRGKILPLPM
jgi:hypothetical protein